MASIHSHGTGKGHPERRENLRKQVAIPVLVQMTTQPSELRVFPATIDNLSLSGAYLTLERDKLPLGQEAAPWPFEMLFTLGARQEVLTVHCALRRIERRETVASIAAEFHAMDTATHSKLDAFLQSS